MSAEQNKNGTLELEVRREFSFPRDLVFEAWTKKEHLHKWMGPTPEIGADHIEIDFREGASFRLGFVEEGQPVKYVHGVYQMIMPPEKLVFTWVWEEPSEHAGVETLVTVNFIETDKGTQVVLLHQRFATQKSCEEHRWGWNGTLDKMANFLPDA